MEPVDVDSTALIELVQERRPIWDLTSLAHNNREVIRKLWQEISAELGVTSDVARNKWRGLRENYRKELSKKKMSAFSWRSKWIHYNQLSFLKGQFIPRRNSAVAELAPEGDDDVSDVSDVSRKRAADVLDGTEPQRVKKSVLEPMVQLEERVVKSEPEASTTSWEPPGSSGEVAEVDYHDSLRVNGAELHDADYHFLMSLLPFLRAVPLQRKMFVRRKLEDAFIEEY